MNLQEDGDFWENKDISPLQACLPSFSFSNCNIGMQKNVLIVEIYLFVHLSIHPTFYLSSHPSIHPSTQQTVPRAALDARNTKMNNIASITQ